MAFRRRSSSTPEIPLASTADVAFLLLVFFLVAASSNNEEGVALDLPNTETTKQQQQETNVELKIEPNRFFIGEEEFDETVDLAALLRQKLEGKSGPDERVVPVQSQGSVTYARWSEVMRAIEEAGGVAAPQIEEGGGGGSGETGEE